MLPLKVLIASQEGKIFEGDAVEVILPSVDGDIAILKDHQPILAALKKGKVVVKDESKELSKVEIFSGLASVDQNDVEIAVQLSE